MPQERHSQETRPALQYLKDISIPIFRNVGVRIATFVAIVLFAISGTAAILKVVSIDPRTEKLANAREQSKILENEIDELEREGKSLQAENRRLESRVDSLSQATKVPTLISPVDNRPIIGQYVTFKWNYAVDAGFRNFILELRRVGAKENLVTRYPIPDGHKRRQIQFQFPEPMNGEFFWRIGTGELLQEYGQSAGIPTAKSDNETEAKQGARANDEGLKDQAVPTVGQSRRLPSSQEETRLWSRYGRFSIYKSVWEKLKRTGSLVVGTTAAYLSYDYPVDCGGRPESYDMELIDKLAEELESRLIKEIKVQQEVQFELEARHFSEAHDKRARKEFKETLQRRLDGFNLRVITKIIDWDEKFSRVISGDVDLVIANLTKSAARERDNPGLGFSKGYRKNRQTIIASKLYPPFTETELEHIRETEPEERDLRRLVKGKQLAAQATSTNLEAAIHLKEYGKFDYVIETNPYTSYVDVIDQVRSGKVDLGMIDETRFNSVGYPDLMQLTVSNKYLEKFYEKRFGTKYEQYGIAVANYGGRNLFLYYLNQAIDETAHGRKVLEEKYQSRTRRERSQGTFGCGWLPDRPWTP